MRDCVPIIVLALVAICGLTWTIVALRSSLARERRLARGDDLVRSAATILRGALRATDLVARLGRDEFIALLPETSAASARIVLDKLRAGLADLRLPDGRPATPSIGGVTFLNPPHAVEEIIRATDERIAEAKSMGAPSHITWNAAPSPGLEGR